jgi:hypothetical protein
MQTKRRRAKLAKLLRKDTGLSFVESLKVAKNLLRGTGFTWKTFCECCGPEPVVEGPKGYLDYTEVSKMTNQCK